MASSSSSSLEGTRLKNWSVGRLLGRGAFGGVYEARADGDPTVYALKVVPLKGVGASKLKKSMTQGKEAALLYKEYNLYSVHFKHPESPHLARLAPRQPYGEDGEYRWLGMQRMGRSLKACLVDGGGTAPWPTVANVAVQMIEALGYIHSKRYLYVDVNSENFMVGAGATSSGGGRISLGKKSAAAPSSSSSSSASSSASLPSPLAPLPPTSPNTLYCIDFGLAEPSRTVMGEAKPATENGTPLFTSRAGPLGRPMSPWDDLESAGYLLLFCLGGQRVLPWGAAATAPEAAKAKTSASPDSLVAALTSGTPGLPAAAAAAMKAYLKAVWEGTAATAVAHAGSKPPPPDYAKLTSLFAPHAGKTLVWTHAAGSGSGAAAAGRKRAGSRSPAAKASAVAATAAGGGKGRRGTAAAVRKPASSAVAASSSSSSSGLTPGPTPDDKVNQALARLALLQKAKPVSAPAAATTAAAPAPALKKAKSTASSSSSSSAAGRSSPAVNAKSATGGAASSSAAQLSGSKRARSAAAATAAGGDSSDENEVEEEEEALPRVVKGRAGKAAAVGKGKSAAAAKGRRLASSDVSDGDDVEIDLLSADESDYGDDVAAAAAAAWSGPMATSAPTTSAVAAGGGGKSKAAMSKPAAPAPVPRGRTAWSIAGPVGSKNSSSSSSSAAAAGGGANGKARVKAAPAGSAVATASPPLSFHLASDEAAPSPHEPNPVGRRMHDGYTHIAHGRGLGRAASAVEEAEAFEQELENEAAFDEEEGGGSSSSAAAARRGKPVPAAAAAVTRRGRGLTAASTTAVSRATAEAEEEGEGDGEMGGDDDGNEVPLYDVEAEDYGDHEDVRRASSSSAAATAAGTSSNCSLLSRVAGFMRRSLGISAAEADDDDGNEEQDDEEEAAAAAAGGGGRSASSMRLGRGSSSARAASGKQPRTSTGSRASDAAAGSPAAGGGIGRAKRRRS